MLSLCYPRLNNTLLLPENLPECSTGMLGSLWRGELPLAAAPLYKEPQWQIQSDQLRASAESHTPGRSITVGRLRASLLLLFDFICRGTLHCRWRHEGKEEYAAAGGQM